MSDVFGLFLFIVGYYVLMNWILPHFGVETCLSRNCIDEENETYQAKHKNYSLPFRS